MGGGVKGEADATKSFWSLDVVSARLLTESQKGGILRWDLQKERGMVLHTY